ncbi:MAG TPA: hypothetical protein VGF57_09550 [Roseiarcus sp.]|jgi:hypothetical protein
MTMIERLLALAEELAEKSSRSPTLRRRAVSTAYYAVFHALAELCANELLGVEASRRSNEYVRIYRSLDHGTLKTAFAALPLSGVAALQRIGNRVVRLQSERIRSDYLPQQPLYTTDQSVDLVKSAKTAVLSIAALPPGDRRTLAVHLLFKHRPS